MGFMIRKIWGTSFHGDFVCLAGEEPQREGFRDHSDCYSIIHKGADCLKGKPEDPSLMCCSATFKNITLYGEKRDDGMCIYFNKNGTKEELEEGLKEYEEYYEGSKIKFDCGGDLVVASKGFKESSSVHYSTNLVLIMLLILIFF